MLLYCILDLPYSDSLPTVLFSGCGIIFSVGMSQLMTYDLKEVVNEEVFNELTKSIKFFKKAFVMQFYYTSLAYLFLEIISKKYWINKLFTIRGLEFTLDKFFIMVLFYSFFYFLNNFYVFSEKKMKLDGIIRKEKMEED
jgi:hypothetical protein